MLKYRVLLDMDGVMFNTLGSWLNFYNLIFKKKINIEDVTDYGFSFLPKNEKEDLFSLVDCEGFYRYIEPIKNAPQIVEAIQSLECEVYVVTCGMHGNTVPEKLASLEEHFPFLGRAQKYTIFSHRKDLIKGDILFDDNPRNLEQFAAAGGVTCAMDYKYNRDVITNYRVMDNDWIEFYNIVVNEMKSKAI